MSNGRRALDRLQLTARTKSRLRQVVRMVLKNPPRRHHTQLAIHIVEYAQDCGPIELHCADTDRLPTSTAKTKESARTGCPQSPTSVFVKNADESKLFTLSVMIEARFSMVYSRNTANVSEAGPDVPISRAR